MKDLSCLLLALKFHSRFSIYSLYNIIICKLFIMAAADRAESLEEVSATALAVDFWRAVGIDDICCGVMTDRLTVD